MYMGYRNYVATKAAQAAFAFSTIIALFCFMSAAVPQAAHADDARTKCQRRIEHARDKLDHAVREHGERSPQADRAWIKLRSEREKCWQKFNEWWDSGDNKWHHDHDWDRDPRGDHDRPGGSDRR